LQFEKKSLWNIEISDALVRSFCYPAPKVLSRKSEKMTKVTLWVLLFTLRTNKITPTHYSLPIKTPHPTILLKQVTIFCYINLPQEDLQQFLISFVGCFLFYNCRINLKFLFEFET